MNPEEIYGKLSSEDEKVLKQSISYINEKNSLIRERSTHAESRATAMLTVSGILAGFIVFFVEVLNNENVKSNFIVTACYIVSVLLLIKAVLFAVRVFWVQKGYELTPDLIYDLQTKTDIQALKEELKWKIWEYYEILPLTSTKLFWLSRSQRNTVMAIITLMILGLILFLKINICFEINSLVKSLLLLFTLLVIIFVDIIFEFLGSFWNRKSNTISSPQENN